MSESLEELRSMPEEELIKRHDSHANSTAIGVEHYLVELARRDQDKQTNTMLEYTRGIKRMTVIITLLTAVNVLIACLFLFKPNL